MVLNHRVHLSQHLPLAAYSFAKEHRRPVSVKEAYNQLILLLDRNITQQIHTRRP